jgi:hypothetical protein
MRYESSSPTPHGDLGKATVCPAPRYVACPALSARVHRIGYRNRLRHRVAPGHHGYPVPTFRRDVRASARAIPLNGPTSDPQTSPAADKPTEVWRKV